MQSIEEAQAYRLGLWLWSLLHLDGLRLWRGLRHCGGRDRGIAHPLPVCDGLSPRGRCPHSPSPDRRPQSDRVAAGALGEQIAKSSIPSIIIKQPADISSQLEKGSSKGISRLKSQEVLEVLDIPLPHAGWGTSRTRRSPFPGATACQNVQR